MHRRRFLALSGAAGMGAIAGCTIEQERESSRDIGQEIALDPVIEGLTFPTAMTFLPDGSRLVCERTGQIVRQPAEREYLELFVDLSGRMDDIAGEKGLVGLTRHPAFEETRKLYVRYSAPTREEMDTDRSHTEVLSELTVTTDGTGVVPDSERIVLEVPQPGDVHNAGDLAFGPDGYLYVVFGDGRRTDLGAEGWSWWYDQGQEAQNTTDNLLGGIVRIDVDDATDDRPYAIPDDNPLVDAAGRDEYYAWGLRNPYRISFDDGRLFVADVGEHTREMVYIVEKGDNCGWPVTEGSSCSPPTPLSQSLGENPLNFFNPKTWVSQTNRISPRKVCPTPEGVDGPFVDPIVEYHRSGARAVTGGFVYRGDAVPSLRDAYLFGDLIPPAPIFATEEPDNGSKPWPMTELVVQDTDSGRLDDQIISFARDPVGEVYVLTTQFEEGAGLVRQITAPA